MTANQPYCFRGSRFIASFSVLACIAAGCEETVDYEASELAGSSSELGESLPGAATPDPVGSTPSGLEGLEFTDGIAENYFWSAECLHSEAAQELELGTPSNPESLTYIGVNGWRFGTIDPWIDLSVSSNASYPMNEYNNTGCEDGYLVDVYGTAERFGVEISYTDTLPTSEAACENTSIWISGYTYGEYVGAYADYHDNTSKWSVSENGWSVPYNDQTPFMDNMYALSSSRYGRWVNGHCEIDDLWLTYRHPPFEYSEFFPWYRLVIGGFRGTSATAYVDRASMAVRVGHDSSTPRCERESYCERGGSSWSEWNVRTVCENGDVSDWVGYVGLGPCPNSFDEQEALVLVGFFITIAILL